MYLYGYNNNDVISTGQDTPYPYVRVAVIQLYWTSVNHVRGPSPLAWRGLAADDNEP
jgi:hypothetical protein